MTVTNINVLQGATLGTDSWIAILYNSAGTKLATSSLSGVATGTNNTFKTFALTAPIAIQGPGRYFVGVQSNGNTDKFRLIPTGTFIDILSALTTGTFATVPNITVPTTFTTVQAPIVYLN